jgi:WD repeat-containing protein 76
MAQVLTEYERKRQERIAQNQRMLGELNLQTVSRALVSKKRKSESPAAPRSRKVATRVKTENFEPVRQSSRLRGIKADDSQAKKRAEKEMEEQEKRFREEAAKRRRKVGDLNMSDITGKNSWLWDPKDGEVPVLPKAEASEHDEDLKSVRQRLAKLSIWKNYEPNGIKLTVERGYSLAFHPTVDKALVFCGDKDGNLGIFDSSQSKVEIAEDDEYGEVSLAITKFKPHSRTISGVAVNNSQLDAVFTCSYDESIRKVNLATQISSEVLVWKDSSEPFTAMQFVDSQPNLVYFSTLYGWAGYHDMRTGNQENSSTQSYRLSELKIGGFSVHPTNPHLLAAGSLDRTLRLWDLRMISGTKPYEKKPHMVGEHSTRLSVSNAAFNSAGQVAAASYDDTVKIYDFSNLVDAKTTTLSNEEMQPLNIPHNNQTGKWVTMYDILSTSSKANRNPDSSPTGKHMFRTACKSFAFQTWTGQ